jgi:hypothetical protein
MKSRMYQLTDLDISRHVKSQIKMGVLGSLLHALPPGRRPICKCDLNVHKVTLFSLHTFGGVVFVFVLFPIAVHILVVIVDLAFARNGSIVLPIAGF